MTEGEISAIHFATRKPVQVRWKNGKISSVDKPQTTPPRNLWIAPSLIDLQINGYGGIDFQRDDLTLDELISATRQLRRDGCAHYLLTLITDDWVKLTNRLKHIKALRTQSPELQAAIVGWHIEGPFLSSLPGFHGAHNPALMCDPTPAHIHELRKITQTDPTLLTLAPERAGSLEAIKLAVSLGIKISLGHTDASSEIFSRAVEAGATGFSHLGNGCPRELDRQDNILWRIFETQGITASLIPDKIHVSPPLFRLTHRAMNSESIYYTSDAMSAAGSPPGKYKLAGMELEVGADQVVRLPGTKNFAGSALRPIDGIFRAAEMLNCDWQNVWPHFSTNAARLMNLPFGLSPGQAASFCLLKFSQTGQFKELQVQV